MIRCQTLGPVEVTVDGAPAPAELLWRKHLALLVLLARAPRRTRSREQLTGLLWAEKAESAARHSLNEALRVVRRSAGDDALDTRGDQVILADGALSLDVDELERLAGAGDLAGASALVIGEFLEGFGIPGAPEFEHWLFAERLHWTGRSVAVLTAWSGSLATGGRVGEAVAAAERALRLDPLAESAVEAMLRGTVLQGERSVALERYEEYAALVRERLAAEPAARIRALADRIRQDRSRNVRPAGVPAGVTERRRVPLTGRGPELATLLQAWNESRAARAPRVAVLIADPGMGRTRLAEELAARVRLDGGVVAQVRAVSGDRDQVDGGLLALAAGELAEARGVAAAPPGAIAALSGRVESWAERYQGRAAGAAGEGYPMASALLAVLRAAAEEAPVLLWVDDAHFLDAASLAWLERIPRDLAGVPILLLVSAATHIARDEIDAFRSRVGREVQGVTLTLGPLDPDAIRALAGWALPTYSPTELERVSRRLAHDAAGLPLLVVELLDAVSQGLELGGERGAWPQPFRTLDQTMPGELPDSITAAIRMSFRRLSADAQKVLAASSVLGDRVLPGDLARATELPQAAVLDALDELEWSRWLVAEPRGYAFLARVVRDVIARDMLTPGQRRRLTQSLTS